MAGKMSKVRAIGLPFLLFVSFLVAITPIQNAMADVTLMDTLTGGTNSTQQCSGRTAVGNRFCGEEITSASSLVGQGFNKISLNMRKAGAVTLTGTAYIGIWTADVAPTSGNYLKLIATFDPNTLTTSSVTYAYSFSGWVLQQNQAVGLYYDVNGASDAYQILLDFRTTDGFDSTSTYLTLYDNSPAGWSDSTSTDVRMKLEAIGDIGITECPDLSVCFDTDGDGIIDKIWNDDNGDGIVDFDWSDLPTSASDPRDSIPGFLTVFGFNQDAADLIATIIVHALVIFGIPGGFFVLTKISPPMFVWVFAMVLGGGLSAAIGFMPLLFFFVEVALIVGAVAALIKSGVIGT